MKADIKVDSEIGKLNGVIIHTPGPEVENMTPKNAERALYSDILNLSVAREEFSQLSGVLEVLTSVYELKDLLAETLQNSEAKINLLKNVCESDEPMLSKLDSLSPARLTQQLIEGVENERGNLTKYLSREKYDLKPLHNFFFTRDSSVVINDKILISNMASKVRQREALIMQNIFRYHPAFSSGIIDQHINSKSCINCSIEGGDIIVARADVLVIGNGSRTTTQGIDMIIEMAKKYSENKFHIIVQELPSTPESFIHLDMVFTILDRDKYMAFEPLILRLNKYQTVHIEIDNHKVTSIRDEQNIPSALKKLGMDMDAVICGGSKDPWVQEREQWHSGANFFAVAPGKLLGYSRNIYTLEEMSKHGFEIIKAKDIISGLDHPDNYKRCVITIEGSELSRGGGGARCMTMPLSRQSV